MVGRQTRKELMNNWRIRLCVGAVLVLGILPLLLLGLKFGMDFKGGTLIQLQLDIDNKTAPGVMSTTTTILQERLNRYGLRDISVKPYGDRYITVAVSTNESGALSQLKTILASQGKFEAVIDSKVVLYSEDLTDIKTSSQDGYVYLASTGQWRVPFQISKEGSDRFAAQAAGKCAKVEGETKCSKIYMFIDRPDNAVLIMPPALYANLSIMSMSPNNPRSPPITIEDFSNNSLTPIIQADAITPELVTQLENYSKVLVHPSVTGTELLENKSFRLEVVPEPIVGYWPWSAVGLESVLNLTPGVTSGAPIREAVIEGARPMLRPPAKR